MGSVEDSDPTDVRKNERTASSPQDVHVQLLRDLHRIYYRDSDHSTLE